MNLIYHTNNLTQTQQRANVSSDFTITYRGMSSQRPLFVEMNPKTNLPPMLWT